MTETSSSLVTPVLLLVFNRPSLTRQVFERIRATRPTRLLIAGDGPRHDHEEDAESVAQTRTVADMVDWDCEVTTLFRDHNLGCARAVSSAIDWAFDSVDELIVLEDDCLPAASFFPYCTELLDLYRDDYRVFVISGDNFQKDPPRTPHSYYFSRYNHCWGWATWKRAWRHFDLDMRVWPEIRDGGWLADILNDDLAVKYWTRIFDAVHAGEIDTWDYQWTFACWAQSGLTVLPSVNLVENIGFGRGATHTTEHSAVVPTATELRFPMSHPPYVIRDVSADSATQRHHFGTTSRWPRLRNVKKALFARNP